MKRNYYIFKSGRLRRKDNTLYFEPAAAADPESEAVTSHEIPLDEENAHPENGSTEETASRTRVERKPIPVEDVEAFYLFGEVDLNTKLLNFLSQQNIPIHIFNYYGFYSGTYYPREYLNSGYLLVQQVMSYCDDEKRLVIAREFARTATDNLLRNIKYYKHRKEGLDPWQESIESKLADLEKAPDIGSLMAAEGRIRDRYYKSLNEILNLDFEFTKRVKQPPDNMVNAMISFGNSLMYTTVLGEIYRTQLNPTISYLHEPGTKRYSLSLDLAEVFKPIIVDRMLFKLINTKMIQEDDFDEDLNYCYLKEKGKKVVLKEYDERLDTTIKHRGLGRNVSYRHLIRLECYKLIKHLTGMEEYKGFRAWW
jgi:CRISPR-associated protein Cas1